MNGGRITRIKYIYLILIYNKTNFSRDCREKVVIIAYSNLCEVPVLDYQNSSKIFASNNLSRLRSLIKKLYSPAVVHKRKENL